MVGQTEIDAALEKFYEIMDGAVIPSILIGVGLFTAVLAILSIILVLAIGKGKSGPKALGGALSLIGFILSIVGVISFAAFTVIILMGMSNPNPLFYSVALGPANFGMPVTININHSIEFSPGLSVGLYAAYLLIPAILGVVAFLLVSKAKKKSAAANMGNAPMTDNIPVFNPMPQTMPADESMGAPVQTVAPATTPMDTPVSNPGVIPAPMPFMAENKEDELAGFTPVNNTAEKHCTVCGEVLTGPFCTNCGAPAPADEVAPVVAPVEEAPVEEAPVEEAPVEEAPAEKHCTVCGEVLTGPFCTNCGTAVPTEEVAPVEEAPVEEAPVEEAPVEEAPVEEAPVEEAPVEETPAEKHCTAVCGAVVSGAFCTNCGTAVPTEEVAPAEEVAPMPNMAENEEDELAGFTPVNNTTEKHCTVCGAVVSGAFCTNCGTAVPVEDNTPVINASAEDTAFSVTPEASTIPQMTDPHATSIPAPMPAPTPTPAPVNTGTKCPVCGKELPSDTIFCTGCGTRVINSQNASAVTPAPAPMPAPTPAPAPVNTGIKCLVCGKELPSDTVFCTGCGTKIINNQTTPVSIPTPTPAPAPVPAPAPAQSVATCSNCGKPITPGSAFCTGCGARVSQSSPAPVQESFKFCNQCGTKLPGSSVFCTKCGNKLQ